MLGRSRLCCRRRSARDHGGVDDDPRTELCSTPAALPALAARCCERLRDADARVPGRRRGARPAARRRPPDLDFVVDGDRSSSMRSGGWVASCAPTTASAPPLSSSTAPATTWPGPGGRRYAPSRRAARRSAGAASTRISRRRDFTVNAMALALGWRRAGAAAVGLTALGRTCDARRLRVLHDASFPDDPTRLLRLARYAGRLGFSVEPRTRGLARAAVAGGALDTVSGARLGHELRLLAAEPDPVGRFVQLHELGIDRSAGRPGFGLADPELAARALALLPADGDRACWSLAGRGLRRVDARQLSRAAGPAGLRGRSAGRDRGGGDRRRGAGRALAARQPAVGDRRRRGALPSPELVALAGALGAEARRGAGWRRCGTYAGDRRGRPARAPASPPGRRSAPGLAAALAAKLDGRATGRESELAEALRGRRRTLS